MELRRYGIFFLGLMASICSAQSPAVTEVTVSYSATPTFTATAAVTNFTLTLTGNVTSSTFASPAVGVGSLHVCQDATGGRTFVAPTGSVGFGTIDSTASKCSTATWKWDGATLRATSPFTRDDGTVGGGGAVSSVFGRTGAVAAQSGDYSAFFLPLHGNADSAAALSVQYIDWNAASGPTSIANKPTIPSAGGATPNMDGVASAGASSSFARQDHTHPTDTSRAAANASTTVNGQPCALGSSCTVTAAPSGAAGGGLTGSFPNPGIGALPSCAGTPGNTTGAYRSTCTTSGGALYVCANASGCTVAGDWAAQGGSGAVSSVFGRTGVVTAQSGDYAVGQLSAGALPAGSTIAIPQWSEFTAAVCQGTTASIAFSTPASNAPLAACKTGTNTQQGVAQFTATGQSVQGSFVLPDDWSSVLSVEFRFLSETAASTGNVVWDFAYACIASTGASIDPSFAVAQTATVAAGSNNTNNSATISTPTISGCSAGQRMYFRLGLNASTTASGNQDLLSVRLKIKRTVTAL